MALREAVIVAACRTPIAQFGGSFSSLKAPQLGSEVRPMSNREAQQTHDAIDCPAAPPLSATGKTIEMRSDARCRRLFRRPTACATAKRTNQSSDA